MKVNEILNKLEEIKRKAIIDLDDGMNERFIVCEMLLELRFVTHDIECEIEKHENQHPQSGHFRPN